MHRLNDISASLFYQLRMAAHGLITCRIPRRPERTSLPCPLSPAACLLSACILINFLLPSCLPYPTNRHDPPLVAASLPEDENPHVLNSLEWWYFTGLLRDTLTGHRYGIEYVFFHSNPENYHGLMAHFAITDPQTGSFLYDSQLKRLKRPLQGKAAAGLQIEGRKGGYALKGSEGHYSLKGKMTGEGNASIQLQTRPIKPIALHGNQGVIAFSDSQKVGYYSYPRLAAEGILELRGEKIPVSGELWYDRQWNVMVFPAESTSWAWYSIRLDSPRAELMLYVLRRHEAGISQAGGSWIEASGKVRPLQTADVSLDTLAEWCSDISGQTYAVEWAVHLTEPSLNLKFAALLPAQELKVNFSPIYPVYYWEGLVEGAGTLNGKPVRCTGYVEMTNPQGKILFR